MPSGLAPSFTPVSNSQILPYLAHLAFSLVYDFSGCPRTLPTVSCLLESFSVDAASQGAIPAVPSILP